MRPQILIVHLLIGLSIAGCQHKKPEVAKPEGAWLLMRRDVGSASRLVLVDAREPGVQRAVLDNIPGSVVGAVVADRGRTLFVAIAGQQIWRVRTQPKYTAEQIWQGKDPVHLMGASADGRVLLVGHGRLLLVQDDGAKLVDLEAPAALAERNGDVSEDGQRVLLSFIPAGSCKEQPFKGEIFSACALEIWGFDRTEGKWRTVVKTEQHSYNPRFVPGTQGNEIYFHSPVPDEKCRGRPLWGCGVEDLYRVGFDGSGRTLVRRHTWVPRFSPDGKWVAVSSPWDEGALLVGQPGGSLEQIANGARYALQWSADSKWIAYQATDGLARVIERDGSGSANAGEGRPVGWLAAAIPAGQVVPPTPTEADHAMEALRRLNAHRQGNEPVGLLDIPAVVADEASPYTPERFARSHELVEFVKREERVLALLRLRDLCSFHRECETRGIGYAVLEDPRAPFLLVTNHAATTETDTNPMPRFMTKDRPESLGTPISATLGDAVDVVGVEMPASVRSGETFRMTIHYHVQKRIEGDWKTFVHFDGAGLRFQADHRSLCRNFYWPEGAWIADSFEVNAAEVAGTYTAFAGFFANDGGAWKRMPVTAGANDSTDRVPLGKIEVR